MPAYKDASTGKWYAKFYYIDYTGKKRQKLKRGFDLQRDAKEWERAFLERLAGSPDMLFSALAENYLDDKKENNKQISYLTRKSRIDNWILPAFKDKPINTITKADVRNWQNDLKKARKTNGKPYAPHYLSNIVDELSEMFNYAVNVYDLSFNPIKAVGKTAGKKTRVVNFWTREEFDSFIGTFDQEDPFYTIFLLLYFTGMRIGELLALTSADFDPEDPSIRINKTYHQIDKQDVVTTPKTDKGKRSVILPAFVSDTLKTYISRLYGNKKHDRLFPYTEQQVLSVFKSHATDAGVKQIRLHDLRHSHAALLIDLGFSIFLIAERLGHAKVSTTMDIYGHLYPSKQSEAAERIQTLYNDTNLILKYSADKNTDANGAK